LFEQPNNKFNYPEATNSRKFRTQLKLCSQRFLPPHLCFRLIKDQADVFPKAREIGELKNRKRLIKTIDVKFYMYSSYFTKSG
jgi:hypothetical protein